MFDTKIRQRGWGKLNNIAKEEVNRTITFEFFANAHDRGSSFVSYVRGKEIDYSATEINRLLGLTAPRICDIQERRKPLNVPDEEKWDSMLNELGRPGASWKRASAGSNPSRLNTVDLMPIPKAWASFLTCTLESTSSTSQLPVKNIFALQAILSDNSINVGELIASNIKEHADKKRTSLGHACLISALCKAKGIQEEPGDLKMQPKGPINDVIMRANVEDHETYMMEYTFRLNNPGVPFIPRPVPEEPQPQAPPVSQHISQHPLYEDYMFGMASWAQDAAAQWGNRPPFFSQRFMEASQQHMRQHPQVANTYERFRSQENLDAFIVEQRNRAAEMEQLLRADFQRGEEEHDLFDSMQQDQSGFR